MLHKNIVKGNQYAVISFMHLSKVSELELQLPHAPLYKASRDNCLSSTVQNSAPRDLLNMVDLVVALVSRQNSHQCWVFVLTAEIMHAPTWH